MWGGKGGLFGREVGWLGGVAVVVEGVVLEALAICYRVTAIEVSKDCCCCIISLMMLASVSWPLPFS